MAAVAMASKGTMSVAVNGSPDEGVAHPGQHDGQASRG